MNPSHATLLRLALIASFSLLAACGQKGPLFLPDYDRMMNPEKFEDTTPAANPHTAQEEQTEKAQ